MSCIIYHKVVWNKYCKLANNQRLEFSQCFYLIINNVDSKNACVVFVVVVVVSLIYNERCNISRSLFYFKESVPL